MHHLELQEPRKIQFIFKNYNRLKNRKRKKDVKCILHKVTLCLNINKGKFFRVQKALHVVLGNEG